MEVGHTPFDNINIKLVDSSLSDLSISSFFINQACSNFYIEIFNKDKDIVNIIFRRAKDVNSKKEIKKEKINQLKEIKIIFDFQCLSYELSLENVKNIIYNFYNNINNNTKLSVIIQNTIINKFSSLVSLDNKLKLNELIISDELYNISPNLNILFPEIKVNKLVLKKFKINSRLQLTNFCNFILGTECKELILEDIFIELILKNDENDKEYNDLNCYFTYNEGIITLNNQYTYIRSLTLRDCPLFVITKNMFILNKEIDPRIIDIDENSLINPTFITKFKIIKNKFHLCFDLDSYKIKKEEENNDDNNNNNKKEDYLYYLSYIFNIIIGFKDDSKIQNNIEEDEESDDEEENIGNIDRECFYKLKFKNFDVTKYEYITNDGVTSINEDDWILNNKEKERKEKWETFEEKLKKFKFEKLSNVKMLVINNCSNFFIQWILNFVIRDEVNIKKSYNDDFELLKLKKCGKDYIELKNILPLKIKHLILFDTPLIIDSFNKNYQTHLEYFNNNLGTIENLYIIINSLDYFNKENNLNIYKTMEILIELIQSSHFNKNLSFGMNALSMIMTFLVYRKYHSNKKLYYNGEIEEKGEDLMSKGEILKIKNETKKDINNDSLTCIPKKFFFCCKKYREYLINESFNLKCLEEAKITLINGAIKKQSENFEYLNYLYMKSKKYDKKNNEIKKLDYGINLINIDKDYKLFFSINNIDNITLKNVIFSNSINSLIKEEEGITFINLVSFTEEEKNIIKMNNYSEPKIPNYKIDMKTLNGLLFKNYLFEDLAAMFRYFMMKVEQTEEEKEKQVSKENADKKLILMEYFKNYSKIFNSFKQNIKRLTVILNDIKELKEFFCIISLYKVIMDEKNWFKEILIANNKKKEVSLPNKEKIEKEIGSYFLKDKNEKENEVYSEFNYYFSHPAEKNLLMNKKIEINDYTYYIDCLFDDYL